MGAGRLLVVEVEKRRDISCGELQGCLENGEQNLELLSCTLQRQLQNSTMRMHSSSRLVTPAELCGVCGQDSGARQGHNHSLAHSGVGCRVQVLADGRYAQHRDRHGARQRAHRRSHRLGELPRPQELPAEAVLRRGRERCWGRQSRASSSHWRRLGGVA